MNRRNIWEIDFEMVGPITINREVSFNQEKGFDMDQFYSEITLRKSSYGINATITAYANNAETAERVAYVYFGRMIDVLSLNNDVPIKLSIPTGNQIGRRSNPSRRVLEKSEIKIAFNMARKFEMEQPKLLRAISWYSKAILDQNTLDKFMAYWNVIEILGSEYHSPTERTDHGTINKIYQCFLEYFGEANQWNLPDRWINDTCNMRNKLAHGAEDFTIETIINYASEVPLLEQIARRIIFEIINAHYDGMNWEHLGFRQ